MSHRRAIVIAALLVILASPSPSWAGATTVKILSANFSSSTDYKFHDPGRRIIQGLHPDVVLLQEFNYLADTASDYRAFVDTAFGPEYYYYYVEMRGSYYLPNGIISRWPFVSSGYWVDDLVTNRTFVWAKIDLPGDAILQVVSVHFSTHTASDRGREAIQLENYIASNFNSGQYIVVGGDLNTLSASEACISTFDTFLNATSRRPVDQKGNDKTNSSRRQPYDWVMPNSVLDAYHVSTVLLSQSFPDGLVYDSRITSPYSMLPSPIEATDSGVSGMQHMGVLKTFSIPAEPSPTPSPTPLNAIIAQGDYDGDGTSDIGIYRPRQGKWAIRNLTVVYLGNSSDLPVSGDYNGDGTADITVFRPVSGLWAIRNVTRVYHGLSNNALVPGDYDGNGTCEIGVFRASSGLWSVRNFTRIYLGASGDRPVPGNYRGDQAQDMGVFREDSGLWAIRSVTRLYFGASNDTPICGDYTGDGTSEYAVFRGYYGFWSIRNATRVYLGSANDWALPADYNGDGMDEAGIFRDSTGMWSVRDLTRVYFGGTGDIPVTR
jgi:endonuclease/exonuclease/phosphatase family metal-dependent hydrolase